MHVLDSSEITEFVNRVRSWPVESRITLVRRILETLEQPALARVTKSGRSVSELIGIGAGVGPPPDDETVERWIDEYRMEKYG